MPTAPDIALERIIRELSDSSAYPHAVEEIRVVQTHVSCVFLTGALVYKVKKPVQFDFLDYRERDHRRELCLKEVALNRRLCPDVYLDVVPIVDPDGRLRMNMPGDPVEWAVRMRQLRAEDMLPARIAARKIDQDDIRTIAGAIARFHLNAATGPAIRAFGDESVIAANVAGALREGGPVNRDACRDHDAPDIVAFPDEMRTVISAYLERFMAEHADRFSERAREDRIRDCHGDLRAQNICRDPRYEDGVQIFDCIEFNDQFRYIDTASDLAYLAMDLDLAGRPELRQALIDGYQQQAQDPGLLEMLRFYQCFRAVVRGQIARLAAAEAEIPPPDRDAHRNMAAGAYDLACSYAAGPAVPTLMIMVGFSGSGKSALAQELCRRLPAVLLSSDDMRRELAGADGFRALGSDHYTAAARAAVYRELRRRGDGWLRQGLNVLLDATFLAVGERDAAAKLAQDAGAGFWVVEIACPDPEIRRRLRQRAAAGSVSDADVRVYEEQLKSFDPVRISAGAPIQHIIIKESSDPMAAARTVIRRFTGISSQAADLI